jgi:DNA-binding winged helix-turn-helix (wHTH) protein/TolB-like protein
METVRFGLYEFDRATGDLRREGVPVRLQPQPARMLGLLVERAGAVVTREELRRHLWGEATFVDFDRSLNFCAAQVRSALGDTADSPRFIETVPRRGYRFIAPVGPAAATTAAPAGGPDPAARVPPAAASGRRRWLAGAAVLSVLALASAGVYLAAPWKGRAPARIAVVPFDNETGSVEFDPVASGFSDAIVARLASAEHLSRISVIGNAAILRRPRAVRDLKAIGAELGTPYVVLGQVRRDGERVRLIAHFIRVEDEAHVWGRTFDRPAFSLDVQSELVELITREIVARLPAK